YLFSRLLSGFGYPVLKKDYLRQSKWKYFLWIKQDKKCLMFVVLCLLFVGLCLVTRQFLSSAYFLPDYFNL
ncbi:MAG: hypothetical protein KDC83_15245, partial [Flavobacteriales bacterium]|nr:hypothetical protein [Flavobacteriales bacterium]